MSADTNVADVRAFIERASNQGDTTAFDEFLSPDFVGGRERFKGMILGYRRAFPDLGLDVHDIFGAGDKVVSRWTITGTHRRSFLGIAPTEQRIRIEGIAIDLFDAGVRVDAWAQFDGLRLLRQFGAVDAHGPSVLSNCAPSAPPPQRSVLPSPCSGDRLRRRAFASCKELQRPPPPSSALRHAIAALAASVRIVAGVEGHGIGDAKRVALPSVVELETSVSSVETLLPC
jgi:predicted ester cyclase